MFSIRRRISLIGAGVLAIWAVALYAARFGAIDPAEQAAIDRISADSMRGNLSFLASDLLEGRATPSRGLDIAAEFIASRFRSAGLEPMGPDGSYFQQARFAQITPNVTGLSVALSQAGAELNLNSADVRVESISALDLKDAPVVKLPANGLIPEVEGKIVAGDSRRWSDEALLALLQSRKPVAILLFSRRRPQPSSEFLVPLDTYSAPVLRIYNRDAAAALNRPGDLAVTVHVPAPSRRDVTLKNVGGVLRGSDPSLSAQTVLLTAHYDHLGEDPPGPGRRVFHGANDNASGVVSVIDIANALAGLNPRPRRSILFMTFFGEEEGLLGAYYYVRHPVFPLKDTVADINLEQMGRTDDSGGKEVNAFAFTGPSYSDLPDLVSTAARAEGVAAWTKRSADEFFDRSDNYAFALHGVVAHTVVVAFEYPDYHAADDDWQKIDYANMEKVDRGIAAGVLAIANSSERPHWSGSAAAAKYRESAAQ